jgi:hypothetical protein
MGTAPTRRQRLLLRSNELGGSVAQAAGVGAWAAGS